MTRKLCFCASWLLLLALPHGAQAACSVTQGDFDGNGRPDVRINGDTGKQVIIIDDSQTSYQVLVDCNGDGDYTDPGDIDTGNLTFDIETFDVQGKGKDIVIYETMGTYTGASKNLLVTFGPATAAQPNVVQLANFYAVQGNSSIVVDVFGSSGPDFVYLFGAQPVDNSSIILRGDLGAGDDTVYLSPTAMTGSVLTTDFELGPGSNTVYVIPSSPIDSSTLLTNAVGSSSPGQVDTLNWYGFGPVINGSRSLTNMSLLAGNDTVKAVLVPGFFQIAASTVALRVNGGAGNDSFTLNDGNTGTGIANTGALDIDFSGGAGNDLATVDWSGPARGNGTTRFRINGGDGNDILFGAINLDSSASNPNLDFLMQGGRGNDTLFWSVLDPNGAATYRSQGASLADGGPDADLCIFFGSGVHQSLSCESGS